VDQGGDWSLLGQLVQLVHELSDTSGIYLPSLGNKDHVTLHISGGLVVLAVGDLPGEVWDKKGGVADPTDSVIEDLGLRESLVATLVRKNPETGAKKTLDESVERPKHKSNGRRGNVLGSDESVEQVECGCKTDNIPGDIIQSCDC
jgi:hypothetical protein